MQGKSLSTNGVLLSPTDTIRLKRKKLSMQSGN